ncbi:hypothetical protein KDW_08560 [Dictyobacter vulcani]|uniref:Uncharacterized protein n=1 Tax=Dictyobacter vulcani TaxID=2607529 RepID=A0A5J4KCS2_9CHLR|nr:hypothetical protein [Dictyobacter vulcani]GER86694.1 hypothetical protein KDW_08560 [Dictyobacter vulcani]
MTTQEDRLAALEQKVADIELERLYEKNKTSQSPSSDQLYDARQVNHRLTMLLGIASGQEHHIKVMEQDISEIRQELSEIKQDVKTLHTKFDRLEKLLLDRLPPS